MPTSRGSPHLFINIKTPEEGTSFEVNQAVRSWVTNAQHDRRRDQRRQQDSAVKQESLEDSAKRPVPGRCASSSSSIKSLTQSSKKSSNDNQDDFPSAPWTFMPIDPTAQIDKSARRQIQAHVARRQHQRRRELELENAIKLESKSDGTSPSAPVSPLSPISRTPNTSDRLPSTAEDADTAMSDRARPARSTSPTACVLGDHTNKLNVYAQQLDTDGATIWARYLWQEQEHGRLFHAQYQGYKSFGRKLLHCLIFSNEAMLATTVLFTACHLRHHRGEVVMSPAVLRLRSETYNVVQETINNESEQLSDVTILAIVKLALFEAVFGRRDAYRVHMRGIAQMVRLRHGLRNLGFNGYLAHLLMWFDANLSVLTQTSRFLDNEIELAELGQPAGAEKEVFGLGVQRPELNVGSEQTHPESMDIARNVV